MRLRSLLALVFAFTAFMALPAFALADGDPGSDVLLDQSLFYGSDTGVSVKQELSLDRLLQATASAGAPVRVAIIAHADDLGTVTPLATVTVRSQINGQITQIAFTEGQMVKQGDLLAVVDPRPYELQLEQTQGTLAKDQALWKQAQADLARFQILAKQDSIAAQTVDDQVHLVEQ